MDGASWQKARANDIVWVRQDCVRKPLTFPIFILKILGANFIGFIHLSEELLRSL